ncbi:MAG: AAA family ATPase, partial [Bacteroidales bacterium]|nr:AAA family ATPase [Bacteroidales bacterium]
MRLISLRLTNFKGIRDFTLGANGEDVTVYGDNGTGKTTLFDALMWLLFDKDGRNKKDFEIKTLDENNRPLHGLNHEAEGVFDLDGRQLTLRKVYAEKWTKKRGTAKSVFSGHTVDHFIDGVPVKKGEYESKIAALIPENIFKLLTSPLYFNEQLHWTERRKLLLEVCGDISDTDVIASSKELAELTTIIPSGRTLDEHKAVIAARRAEINKELGKIPVRIDEASRALPSITGGIDTVKLPAD